MTASKTKKTITKTTARKTTAKRPAARPVKASRQPPKPTVKLAAKPLLLHPRHSFRLVHHRHTSYPLVTMILSLAVLFCIGWTALVSGDAYTVTAEVPAAPLPTAATIASPINGAVVHSQMLNVNGSCPVNSYVKLYRNQVFSGVALCQSDGSWQLQANLVAGNNQLYAQDYNVTNQPGPASSTITVTYEVPGTGVTDNPASGDIKSSQSTNPYTPSKTNVAGKPAGGNDVTTPADSLIVSTAYTYVGYYVNQLSNWPLKISGGTAPYAVSINWGDGNTDLKSLAAAGSFDLQHTYNRTGGYKNSFTILVTASDAQGQKSVLQLLTIVSPATGSSVLQPGGTTSGQTPSNDRISTYNSFWRVAAPLYGVAFVGLGSFWLGERREFELVGRGVVHIATSRPRR